MCINLKQKCFKIINVHESKLIKNGSKGGVDEAIKEFFLL